MHAYFTIKVLRLSQYLLLQTASDDSLVRLERTALADQQKKLMQLYSEHKQHGSVVGCLNHYIPQCGGSQDGLLLQVSTYTVVVIEVFLTT